jgi:hypothetical protein
VLQTPSVSSELRAQIGDHKDLMHVDQKLVRIDALGLAVKVRQSGVAQRKNLFSFPENEMIAQPILIGDENASHDSRLQINLQGHGIGSDVFLSQGCLRKIGNVQ